ncbi:MAG: hypothetical protein KF822_09415 [Steroidobacteraceae bacterium]|nr:hypothetical protein [Steroidobacteraceae bacterium]
MSKPFFGGIPADIDVRKLEERFGDPQEGQEFGHDEVEAVLGLERGSNRYRTVTDAWRRRLLNQRNIEVGAVPGVGFRCLTPAERVDGSLKGFRTGTRQQLRSVRRAAVVRTEDEGLRHKQDLLRRYGAAISAEASNMMQEIEPPKAQPQMPRLVGSPAPAPRPATVSSRKYIDGKRVS